MSRSNYILTDTDKKAIRYAAYGVGGLVLAGGLFVMGRKFINSGISNRIEFDSIEEGTAPTFAKAFKMAFENNGLPGTNVPAVRRLFRDIPSKDFFDQVVKAYTRLYRENLVRDLSSELTDTEYNEMLNILAPKPQREGQQAPAYDPFAWAKRLKAAFEYTFWGVPGTDNDAVKAVLIEIPTKAVFNEVEKAYEQLYVSQLIPDLKSELEWWEQQEYLDIINNKP